MESQQQQQVSQEKAQTQPTQRKYALHLKNIAPEATSEAFSSLLKENNITHLSSHLQLSLDQKSCNGFGTILFTQKAELISALPILKKLQLAGKTLEHSIGNLGDYNPSTSVFIRSLPEAVNESELLEELQKHGQVLSLMILKDPLTHKSRGSAYIDFSAPEEAKSAIQQLDGKSLPKHDSKISVLPFEQPQRQMAQRAPIMNGPLNLTKQTNLFVNKIPFSMNEQKLVKLFEQYGKIRNLNIKRPQIWANPAQAPFFTTAYAIAYINYDTEEEAAKAIQEINGKEIDNVTLQVEYYDKTHKSTQIRDSRDVIGNENLRILFIRGLYKTVTEDKLRQVCSKFGTVESCILKTGRTPDGTLFFKGSAEVAFSTKQEASEALSKLYFETDLGQSLNIDFFKLKEGRILEHDLKNNPFLMMQQQIFARQQFMNRGPRPQAQYTGGVPPQQQQPQMQSGGAPASQQQNPYQAHQKNLESATQNQYQRPHGHQHNSQYRPKPRNNANRGNQYQQQSYQKKGQNQNQQQQQYQPRANFNQPQMYPPIGGMPPQPIAPFNNGMMGVPPMMIPGQMPFPGQQPPMFQQPIVPQTPVPLLLVNLEQLNSKESPIEKKHYLGELFYDFIEQKYPDEAPKIAGMLLEQSIEQLLQYCANKSLFFMQVDAAFNMIKSQPQSQQ